MEIWDHPYTRLRINEISHQIEPQDDVDERSYKLIQQFCKELGLDYYYDIIKNKGLTTKMFLNSSFRALQTALKEIEPEHISLLFMKAQAHNDRKEFFYNIQKRAQIVEREGIKAAKEVEDALASGRLKETTHDGHTFFIEDPENGNGLCVFKNDKGEQCLCRRREWKAHGFPARYTNNEGNSFYIMAYDYFARMGPYVFYSEQRQQIHYCSKSEKGEAVYKINAHSQQGQLSFEATRLIKGYYEADGETIIIENDQIEYKKYFVAGKSVDWDQYKKNRPEDRLDMAKLENLQR